MPGRWNIGWAEWIKLLPNATAVKIFQQTEQMMEKYDLKHQLEGESEITRDSHWPTCAECGDAMIFYPQLDSLNDEYTLADRGLIYIFVCFECVNVEAFI